MDDRAVGAYLDRIGATRPETLDVAALDSLHRAHLRAVPFENLSLHLGEPVSLAEDDLFEKVVERRRGGFCYELNGLFALLLQTLGAEVELVSVSVYDGDVLGPPFDHLALIVHPADGSGPRLVDVGFGDHSVLSLDLADREEQADPAGTFQLVESEPERVGGVETWTCSGTESRATGWNCARAGSPTSCPPAGTSRPPRPRTSPRARSARG